MKVSKPWIIVNGRLRYEWQRKRCKKRKLNFKKLFSRPIKTSLNFLGEFQVLNCAIATFACKLVNPEITEEDLLFVKEFVENSIGREIKLERKDDAIKLTLDNQEIYGSQYEALHLSTGEQNFISLAFEFLKAKNRKEKIVVLDDPISSFDSI